MLARAGQHPDRPRLDFRAEAGRFRCLVCIHAGYRARSRRGWNMTPLLPSLRAAVPPDAKFDGELVGLDAEGRPSTGSARGCCLQPGSCCDGVRVRGARGGRFGGRFLVRLAARGFRIAVTSADNRRMAAFAGERRIVTVLLVDVVGSTAIGETLGPERSKFLFDEVARLLAAEVGRFGGVVAQFTGDGLYALFGAPRAHDDDAERAVRAAVGMQTVLAAYARDVAEAYGVEVAVRVGVNTGPVVLLRNAGSDEERYNALGDTVNVAARLQTHAGRGGVVVGPDTARHLESAFDLEPLGSIELKGRADPVPGFRVVTERPVVVRRLTPLVGRDDEVAALDAVFSDLGDGRGAIVAVTGEAGIGKSRLVAESRTAWEDRVRFLTAQGVSYAKEVPYYPL